MGRMIPDAIFPLDHLGHPRGHPDLPPKSERFGPLCQQLRPLGQLLRAQFRGSPRPRVMTQGFCPLGSAFGNPLTHRSFGDSQSGGDVFLFPSLLIQFPAAQASSFAPVFWKRGGLYSYLLSSGFRLQTLALCSEINRRRFCDQRRHPVGCSSRG
jgi:hypothetical protein